MHVVRCIEFVCSRVHGSVSKSCCKSATWCSTAALFLVGVTSIINAYLIAVCCCAARRES